MPYYSRKSYPKIIFCTALAIGLLPTKTVFSATLPDAATPGGALPRSLESRTTIVNDSDKLIIPRVIDRPLGVDEGDRVKVREFILKGVRSLPEYNIRKEDVAFIAEANRVNRQRLDEADMEGFTPDEVDEIAEFIRQLVEEPNQRPTSANLWKLVFKLRNSEWNRGLTMGQIQEVADEITRYYRQQGMILATAFVPAQDVAEGKVTIEILEGKLGDVASEGNSMYSDALIQRPFKHLIGKPVSKDNIETGLLYLTDYPGLAVNGIFQPGINHGETVLLVKVIDEKRINGSVSLDNNGSELTGKIRSRLDLVVNSPTGNADQLGLSVLKSFDPSNGIFGSISYTVPVMRSDWQIGASLGHNQFEVDEQELGVTTTGESTIGSGSIKKIFQRNRGLNSYASAELSRKKAVSIVADIQEKTEEFDVASVEIGIDVIDTRFAGINLAILQFHQGLGASLGANGFGQLPGDVKLKGGFQKANFNFSRLQTLKRNFALLVTTQFQYTEDRLNSLEQIPIGGADSVRAYPISEYLKDVGYFASFEFIFNAPGFADKPAFAGRRWGEIFSLSLFFDAGGGWTRDATPSEMENREVHLQGAGVGIKMSLPGKFSVRAQAATVVGDKEPLNDEETERYYLDLAYYF